MINRPESNDPRDVAAFVELRLLQSRPARRWLSLRARAARWLFGTPTTVLEVLNAAMLLTWAGAILDDRMLALPSYSTVFSIYSQSWINEALSAVFFVAFVFALAGIRRHGGRYDVLAGYALQLSALLWVGVAANFLGAYPPINTGAIIYALIALMCWTCGCHLWTRGKQSRRVRGKRACGAVHE